MKSHVLLAISLMITSLSAQAGNPFQPVELSDQELAQLRGRFVMPGRIVHFGVTMSSVWENASGQVLGGQVNMQMSEGMFQPLFTVSTVTDDGDLSPPDSGSGQIHGGSGLASVSGLSQSVRSAGDYNSAYNDISIEVQHGNSAPASTLDGQPFMDTLVSVSNAGSVQISPGDGGFRIAIEAFGQGSSLQQLGSGGLQQQADILGASNRVSNLTAIDLILRDSTMTLDRMEANWKQLGVWRPAGY
jgi:hypothetical protein